MSIEHYIRRPDIEKREETIAERDRMPLAVLSPSILSVIGVHGYVLLEYWPKLLRLG